MSPIRKIKVVKDRMEKAAEAVQDILDNMGIPVISIERGGENFEFTFDRDLTKDPGKLTAIKAILEAKFPEHKIIQVEEE